MSDVFEAWGIKNASPTMLKTYRQDTGLWLARYFRSVKEDAGPAAWRGTAVETGFNAALRKHASPGTLAAQQFESSSMEWTKKNGGEIHPDHDVEAEKVGLCLQRAIEAIDAEPVLKAAGAPSAYQQKREVHLKGAPIPLVGYEDFGFGKAGEGFSLDLKTGNSIPAEPAEGERPEIDPDHGVQFATYAKARGEDSVRALYVSAKTWKTEPKKGEARRVHYLLEMNKQEIEFYADYAVQTLRAMEELLKAALALTEYEFTTKEAALARLCRPNRFATGGGFYNIWKPDNLRAAAEAVPEWGLI